MKVAVIGANGQLGSDLVPELQSQGCDVVPLTHNQIEVSDVDSLRFVLANIAPDVVVNTSAYHNVDEVEGNPGRAFAVNSWGPQNLAKICDLLDATLVHLSTDYVFGGNHSEPYVESDCVDPVNIYGISKAAGEMAIRGHCPRHLIIRSSGLYGHAGASGKGGNFVETMLRLAREGRAIKVVDDQRLTPTSTHALAVQLTTLIQNEVTGSLHVTCAGDCTWHEFAAAVFRLEGLHPDLRTQTTAQSGATARRPPYSVLENRNLIALGADSMPPWATALERYLSKRI